MIRCPHCGLRLRDDEPRCPTHGPQPPEGAAAESELNPFAPALLQAFAERGYTLRSVLGRGGFGLVYGAERDGQQRALKVSFPDQPVGAEQLAREDVLMRRVGAPHVPEVYELGKVDDRPYLAIEFLRGKTLADVLVEAEGPLPLRRFEALARAILRALAAVHAHDIAHRDLKPENIFLRQDGERVEVALIDFGLANDASSRRAGEQVAVTDDDAIGTAEYMSPEQCDGLSDTDTRSDVYSLGALFFELFTGAPPFFGKSADVREAHRSRRPPLLSSRVSCPAALDQVVRRCLAKDRAQRYEDVAALQVALTLALSEPAPQGERTTVVTRAVPAAVPREKRTVGLVFFESGAGLSAVQALVSSSGGQIVQTTGAQYVAAFGHDVGDNPVRIAFAAAQRLSLAKLAPRALVDVAQVSVQVRPDGSRRLFSALFTKKDRFLSADDPSGVVFTGAAADVLPDLTVAPIANDRFLVGAAPARSDATVYGVQHTMVGQDHNLSTLRASALSALTHAQPTLVSVIGEAGYGKSHMARALEQMLERLVADIDVFRLVAQESLIGAASQLGPELLRRALGVGSDPPADPEAVLRARYGELGEQHWVGAAFALGWIDGRHPAVKRLAAAPGALRMASARATGEALRMSAQRAPLAVVLDDAHQADEVALDALEYATMREAHAPIWVCVLARPSFSAARPNWGARAAVAQRTALEALSPLQAGDLARRLLLPAEQVPPIALARLAERTQGVPRLLVELVRGLKRDGLVRRNERGTGHYLAIEELEKLPDLPIVQWNAVREIEALPPQLAAHARLSSVLGSGFTVGELEALLEVLERSESLQDALDASVGVTRLVEAGLLVRHRTGLLDFRYALLRDTIYQQLPPAQLQRLHAAAYEMYRDHDGIPADQRLPRLALHAARSGDKENAASLYLQLAERALASHAYFEAETAYGQALQNLSEDDLARTLICARGRGLMRSRLGRQEEAQRDLKRARECAEQLRDAELARELMLDEATVLDWLRDFAQSAALVKRASEQSDHGMSPLTRARIRVGEARVHHRAGDAEACVRAGREAVEIGEPLGDDGYEVRIIALLMMGPDCARVGRNEEAERFFERCLHEAEAHADLLHIGGVHANRATLWFATRNVPRLYEDLTLASQYARELGDGVLEYVSLSNLGEVSYALDDQARAKETTERALGLVRQLWGEGARDFSAMLLLLARIALQRGAHEEARALLAQLSKRMRDAEAEGNSDALPNAVEQVLTEMVTLSLRAFDVAEWDALESRAMSDPEIQAAEQIELLERRALHALSAGLREESERTFARAIALGRAQPNLFSDRVERAFRRAFSPGSGRPRSVPPG